MSNVPDNPWSFLELVKSALVIPVVVAIVIGLGIGLRNLAQHELARSGKPDPLATRR